MEHPTYWGHVPSILWAFLYSKLPGSSFQPKKRLPHILYQNARRLKEAATGYQQTNRHYNAHTADIYTFTCLCAYKRIHTYTYAHVCICVYFLLLLQLKINTLKEINYLVSLISMTSFKLKLLAIP